VRIAQVVSSYHPRIGGVETHVRRLAQGCAEAGDSVTLLTHQVGDAPDDEWVGAVRVLRFPLTVSSRTYPLSLCLFRYLKRHAADFDLVHAHNYHTLVGHAAVRSGLPFVFTPHYHGTGHTPLATFLHRLYRGAGARLFTAANAVICVSQPECELVTRDFPGPTAKIVVIPNGTDPRRPASGHDGIIPDTPVVLTVGRLERYKNVDLIIDAFRALPTPATLVVVGDGPDRRRLEQRAGAGGPGWPVVFTGTIPDARLDRLFAQAIVVSSASDHEAFGLTLAEGLASGARVVASTIPAHAAVARLVGTDAPVALVDPRDTKRFTDVLAASLDAGRIPPAGLSLPSWAEVAGTTRELYSQVLLPNQLAYRRGPPSDMPLRSLPRAAESAPTESA
jgi:glycosyltransferase involved in cell wall biosynthesis